MEGRVSLCWWFRYSYFVYQLKDLTDGLFIDEFLRLFVCIKNMESSEINKLEGKLTGLRDEGENITLQLVPLKDAWKLSPDAKLLSSLALFHSLKNKLV